VLQTAEKNKKLAFGWDSDMSAFAKEAHLGSAIINWAPYYKKAVKDALDGTWKTEQTWWGVKEGAIDLVAVSDKVPADIKAKVDAARAGFKDGSFHPWKGPITGQDGKVVVEKDKVPDDKFMLGINFYVRGVDGKVPSGDKK
jgi:basic membrane protein A and related proteins